jgi:hypothetical protein
VFGVEIKDSLFDAQWDQNSNQIVCHPFILYLNYKGNIYFDKLEEFNSIIQDSLFSTESILSLRNYTQDEFIPSSKIDVFYSNDFNAEKHKFRQKILIKAMIKLMKFNNEQ